MPLLTLASNLHVSVEEAVFVHERQSLQHLVHDVTDHRLRENLIPAADGTTSQSQSVRVSQNQSQNQSQSQSQS